MPSKLLARCRTALLFFAVLAPAAARAETCYDDLDGDGYGSTVAACSASTVTQGGDCNDGDKAIHPGATEIVDDKIDQDCNGFDAVTCYKDKDGDSYGGTTSWVEVDKSCSTAGGVDASTDCDDGNSAIHPGAKEACNGVDDDCDGTIDDGLAATFFYTDADGDGYGDPKSVVTACSAPTGTVTNSKDCDDTDSSVSPRASETCNGVDDDCDGVADDGLPTTSWYADEDGDGYGDPAVYVDSCSTTPPSGYVASSTDCDDTDHTVNPAATEVCDGVDDDCDGAIDPPSSADALTWWLDADGDGYGNDDDPRNGCNGPPTGYSAVGGDCDDTRKGVYPEAVEQCNGVDDDCNGAIDDGWKYYDWWPDADGDGWGDAGSDGVYDCVAPSDDWVLNPLDCDDMNPTVYPDAPEVCDGVDDDCDGEIDEGLDFRTWYADADDDGWGDAAVTTSWCAPVSGAVLRPGDCDDRDVSVHPGADEVWYDGVDQDCDGNDVDQDGDGVPEGQDCDDADAGPDCQHWMVGGGGGERLPVGCDTSRGGATPALLSLLACVLGMRSARRSPRSSW